VQKVIEQVTGRIVRTITLVMVSHEDKDMSPKMTRGTSIASSSMAILKAANNENALLLRRCKNRCGYVFSTREEGKDEPA